MKVTTTIKYYKHSGQQISIDEEINFVPSIGQIVENKFLLDCSTGVFYISDIDIFKDTKSSYICIAKAWEKNYTELDEDITEAVKYYYESKNPKVT